ncbi:hypothetical protein, conserved [Angomonas deanei]|uniref:C3H1-type domain-containing protein n=1 Tax=Angomonas deanei TaxID=59799 RepID=A0A7G2CEE1_9TRYP|nr:hypothetical protein, conserved [Angomonas deanei]
MRTFTHHPYAPLELSPIHAETAATPPAPPQWFTHHPYALSKISVAEDAPINVIVRYCTRGTRQHLPRDNYREYSFRTQRCEQHTQTGACPLGSRCHNYHTHTAQERKRTFEENRRDNLRTHNDVERWLATRQPSIVSDAVLPPAPLDPEALLRSQQDNYRECSFRTQKCRHYDTETKFCPLGDRCYYYHTRKGREAKRTFDMNSRDQSLYQR